MKSQSDLTSSRDLWSNRRTFILVATGSAVGIGNIWKFPYIAGQNGGGAFVLVYLLSVIVIGIPLMMAEILVGRRGRSSPSQSFRILSTSEGASRHWQLAGSLGVLASFLILTFYSVIGGWSIAYLIKALSNGFAGATGESATADFTAFLASPATLILWHSVFLLFVVIVVSRGISRGIEKAVSVLMPAMFVLLLVLVAYAASTDAFGQSLAFLFYPDFSKLNADVVLVALGHAFFTLSLGMSVMVAYGSFLPANVNIAGAAVTVSILDTLAAILAGLIVFSMVFGNDLPVGSGPGLVFQTMPIAFGTITGGYLIGVLFFFLLLFAAWSSAISLLEPIVERFESHIGSTRLRGAIIAGGVAWLIGNACALSFNVLADFKPVAGKTIFDLLDYVSSNILLPVTGFLVAVFVGWVLSSRNARDELGVKEGPLFWAWRILLRFVTPLLVVAVFVSLISGDPS